MLSLQDPQEDNWLYWKEVGKYVIVYAELFVSLQYKPEICMSMFVTLGSGMYHPSYGHSCNYTAISDVLPSCGVCYSFNKIAILIVSVHGNDMPQEILCDVCLKRDASKDSELAYFRPPSNYSCPENLIDGKYLKEKVIKFKGLIYGWKQAHDKLVSGAWEKRILSPIFQWKLSTRRPLMP
jgi:hypothetical protein